MIDDIVPIILAAGKGSRFGSVNKLLYKINGKFILEMTLNAYFTNFKKILVVVGSERDKISQILEKYESKEVISVYNNDWERGMSSSVRVGISYSNEHYPENGVLIQPGDMPYISEDSVYSVILKAKEYNYQKIIIPQFEGQRGHPLFIPNKLLIHVLEINEENQGLKGFLSKYEYEVIYVESDKKILKDIDRKEDIL